LTIAQRTGTGLTTTALGAGLTTTAPGTGRRATTAPLGPAHPALTTPRAHTTAFASTGMVINARPIIPEARIRAFMIFLLLQTMIEPRLHPLKVADAFDPQGPAAAGRGLPSRAIAGI